MNRNKMENKKVRFSLLLCTYAKDNPQHLSQCLDSILTQTILPDELVIVKDGSLTEDLEAVLESLSFPNKLTIVALPQNVTLGPARAEGLLAAEHEWVAMFDSDDVCLPTRFEKQLAVISEASPAPDIVGGQIIEYDDIPGNIMSRRAVPITHADILARAKKRNPFNAMTVMFRRELALKAGNFRLFPGFEDYDLWTRMLKNNAICVNCPEVLVHARVGNGLFERRRGLGYIKSEWRMQNQLLKLGLVKKHEYVLNVITRIPVRLFPVKWLERAYKRFARQR